MALSNKETEIARCTSMSFPAHKYACLPPSSLRVVLLLLTLSCPFLFLILFPFLYLPPTYLRLSLSLSPFRFTFFYAPFSLFLLPQPFISTCLFPSLPCFLLSLCFPSHFFLLSISLPTSASLSFPSLCTEFLLAGRGPVIKYE